MTPRPLTLAGSVFAGAAAALIVWTACAVAWEGPSPTVTLVKPFRPALVVEQRNTARRLDR
jgi:hypothetical protein